MKPRKLAYTMNILCAMYVRTLQAWSNIKYIYLHTELIKSFHITKYELSFGQYTLETTIEYTNLYFKY